MKVMKLMLMVAMLAPMGSALAADEQPAKENTALEVCQSKIAFAYHFDMMQIESEELRGMLSHDMAAMKKQRRHLAFVGENAVCESENKDSK
jgi:hypothetical protein